MTRSFVKPYSESCDQNREPILAVLKPLFQNTGEVLEIGSGTGQHALYFTRRMPHIRWQTTDLAESLAGIAMWLEEGSAENLPAPLELDVCNKQNWARLNPVDAVFTVNTFHIMSESHAACLFKQLPIVLQNGGLFVAYGPFNYGGRYTSASNAGFDQWLKRRDPASGIRDFEWLNGLAVDAGMTLLEDFEMPANNRILVWQMAA